jgi:hypothetical protein
MTMRRTSTIGQKQDSPSLEFNEEDIDLIFDTLSYSSFNNCITGNSLSQAYNPHSSSTDEIQEPPIKYDLKNLQGGMSTCLKELFPELESDSLREKMILSGINKKTFKKIVKHFQEAMNTTTSTKERDEILQALETECYETICDNDPGKLINLLHLSTILERSDIESVLSRK